MNTPLILAGLPPLAVMALAACGHPEAGPGPVGPASGASPQSESPPNSMSQESTNPLAVTEDPARSLALALYLERNGAGEAATIRVVIRNTSESDAAAIRYPQPNGLNVRFLQEDGRPIGSVARSVDTGGRQLPREVTLGPLGLLEWRAPLAEHWPNGVPMPASFRVIASAGFGFTRALSPTEATGSDPDGSRCETAVYSLQAVVASLDKGQR
ncbi:MAG: hypothetical protein IPK26_23645 [Planctomycetes bacterium]|nr:hypothetical protein [Planctomycetota bacterium]